MSFLIVGSLYQSMRQAELSMKWQERKKNPYLPKGEAEDPEQKRLREMAEKARKDSIMNSLDGKLKAGGELTTDEMEYLRINHPDLYQEAMEVRREREAYRRELSNCKTKEDVQRLNTQKMQGYLAQAKTIQGNANLPRAEKIRQMERIQRRVMGIQTEHIKFTRTAEYGQLPKEEELDEEEKARRQTKKRVSADEEEVIAQPTDRLWLELQTAFDKGDADSAQVTDDAAATPAESGGIAAEPIGTAEGPTSAASGHVYDARGSIKPTAATVPPARSRKA